MPSSLAVAFILAMHADRPGPAASARGWAASAPEGSSSASSSWPAVRVSPGRRPALLASCAATYPITADGTVIRRPRWPALITTSAVITLVMLATGTSVFRSRLQSTRPVDATATAAALARTPAGPAARAVLADRAGLAVRAGLAWRDGLAAAEGTVTARARPAARTAAPTHRDTRATPRARAPMCPPRR